MRKINNYNSGYTNSDKKINSLKYELSNNYGYNIDCNEDTSYNEEKIIKTNCNHRFSKDIKN